MKYQVPKDVLTIYEKGKRYTAVDGIVEIPGEPVGWLKPVKKGSKSGDQKED
jgi:hypothetical protein